MSENVKLLKNALREEYRERRKNIDAEDKRRMDEIICQYVLSLASYRFCETLLMFAPLKYEIDIMPLAETALNQGKKVAFPLCNTENHSMEYRFVSSLDELSVGSYSIREPQSTCEKVADFSKSICIVPAMVFDRAGYRLGYGKGFYDRFLNDYKGTKIGCVYSDFVLDTVPRGHFDRNVDILVTEKGVKIADKSSK